MLKIRKRQFSFSFNSIDYIELFDFKKSKKIKMYEGRLKYILFLDGNIPLEEAKIDLMTDNNIIRKALKKLLSFETLKKFKLTTYYPCNKDFINIPF